MLKEHKRGIDQKTSRASQRGTGRDRMSHRSSSEDVMTSQGSHKTDMASRGSLRTPPCDHTSQDSNKKSSKITEVVSPPPAMSPSVTSNHVTPPPAPTSKRNATESQKSDASPQQSLTLTPSSTPGTQPKTDQVKTDPAAKEEVTIS